jgi:hypothetical protein
MTLVCQLENIKKKNHLKIESAGFLNLTLKT